MTGSARPEPPGGIGPLQQRVGPAGLAAARAPVETERVINPTMPPEFPSQNRARKIYFRERRHRSHGEVRNFNAAAGSYWRIRTRNLGECFFHRERARGHSHSPTPKSGVHADARSVQEQEPWHNDEVKMGRHPRGAERRQTAEALEHGRTIAKLQPGQISRRARRIRVHPVKVDLCGCDQACDRRWEGSNFIG